MKIAVVANGRLNGIFERIRRVRRAAFSLVEVMVGTSVIGVSIVSLYGGFTVAFAMTESARQNLRATQILVERFETIRLYTWDEINTAGFLPSAFTNYYAERSGSTNQGMAYRGTVAITPVGFNSSYKDDMRRMSVTLNWSSGGVNRSRNMTSYIAKYGMQNYIY